MLHFNLESALSQSEDGNFKYYIDYCKITGTGRYRFSWILYDFKKSQRSPDGQYSYLSDAAKYVFDCQLSRSAITSIYSYQLRMARGKVVDSFSKSEGDWQFLDYAPESVQAHALEVVCK